MLGLAMLRACPTLCTCWLAIGLASLFAGCTGSIAAGGAGDDAGGGAGIGGRDAAVDSGAGGTGGAGGGGTGGDGDFDGGERDAGGADAGGVDAGGADAGAGTCGNGVLDDGEVCDPGASACCAPSCDALLGISEVCRPSAGPCDVPDHCDGSGAACPSDERRSAGMPCRAKNGDCDVADVCDGSSVECADAVEPATTVCRGAVDGCDAAESCSGASATCPPDAPVHCSITVLEGALPHDVQGDTTSGCDVFAPSCAGTGANDHAFVFAAPVAGAYDINTLGSSFDTALYVLDGATCVATSLGCDDNYMSGPDSRLIVTLSADQVVTIVVDGASGAAQGAYLLHVARVPPAFSCDPTFWGGDDGCDCGCGVPDPDCPSSSALDCDACNESGSCNALAGCPGTIESDDNSQCTGPPAPVWTCNASKFGTNDGCDCGCGIADPDCGGSAASFCNTCNLAGSCDTTDNGCPGIIDASNNVRCEVPGWTCQANLYGGSDGCDCGCGLLDPDCNGNTSTTACAYCNAPGSCDESGDGCPGDLDPVANYQCQ